LPLEKEGWDNVQPLVQKSLQMVATNMTSIKRWADAADHRLEALAERNVNTEGRLDELDVSLRGTQERLQELTREVTRNAEQSDKEFHAFTTSISKLLDATLLISELFVHSFDPNDGSPRHEIRKCGSQKHGDCLEVLTYYADKLDGHLTLMSPAFEKWAQWRKKVEENSNVMKGEVGGLQKASEVTRERLLSWRELLRDTQQVTGTLSAALERNEEAVRQLKTQKVTSREVHAIVDVCAQRVEESHDLNEKHIAAVWSRIESHFEHVNQKIGEVDTIFQQQLDEQRSSVSQKLEAAMLPVHAFMNTMHVKADEVRMELDRVCGQVPNLQTFIEGVSDRLDSSDKRGREQDKTLSTRLDEIALKSNELFERAQSERTDLSLALNKSCLELGERVTDLQTLLATMSKALDAVRCEELSSLGGNLATLEQKVAKWVHSSQLPAKMSEARLFALEAKLSVETECRLHLEEEVKERASSREQVVSSRGPLPSLPPSRPASTQARPRSKASNLIQFEVSGRESLSGVLSGLR